jgi:hypothetical protein
MIKAILNLFKPKVKPLTDNPEFKNLAKPNEGSKKLIIHVGIKKSSVLTFKDGKGNEFKIFAREAINNYTIGK